MAATAAIAPPVSWAQSSARNQPMLRPARATATLATAQQALAPIPRSTPTSIGPGG